MLVSLIAIIVFTKMLCSAGNEKEKVNDILGEGESQPLTGGRVNDTEGTMTNDGHEN